MLSSKFILVDSVFYYVILDFVLLACVRLTFNYFAPEFSILYVFIVDLILFTYIRLTLYCNVVIKLYFITNLLLVITINALFYYSD